MLSRWTNKLARISGIALLVLGLTFGTKARASECPDPNKIDCGLFEQRGYSVLLDDPQPFRLAWECDEPHEVTGFELAPCTGLLVPHAEADEAIKLKLIEFPALQDEFRLYRLQAEQAITEVEDALKIEQEKNSELNKLLDKNLEPLDPPFYDTFWFGAGVGVVTTVIIVIAVSYAVAE